MYKIWYHSINSDITDDSDNLKTVIYSSPVKHYMRTNEHPSTTATYTYTGVYNFI